MKKQIKQLTNRKRNYQTKNNFFTTKKENKMKRYVMINIRDSRKNLTDFLTLSKIKELDNLFNNLFEVSRKSYHEICDKAIELYDKKQISNKRAEQIFYILQEVNNIARKELYAFDDAYNSIYKYDPKFGAYMFYKRGTEKSSGLINTYID